MKNKSFKKSNKKNKSQGFWADINKNNNTNNNNHNSNNNYIYDDLNIGSNEGKFKNKFNKKNQNKKFNGNSNNNNANNYNKNNNINKNNSNHNSKENLTSNGFQNATFGANDAGHQFAVADSPSCGQVSANFQTQLNVGKNSNSNMNNNNYYNNDNNNSNDDVTTEDVNAMEIDSEAGGSNVSKSVFGVQYLKNFTVVESSYNYQGNYQNYITRVVRSLSPILEIDFEKHVQQRWTLLPEYNKKKTLILDLDETLIHADFDGKFKNHDHTIYFVYEGEEIAVDIFVRPGAHEFLTRLSELFEIFIFTASKKEYADACIDFLDPEAKLIKHRFYRDSCIPVNNKVYVKDLGIFLNRKQENIILVDNSFYSFCNQPKNGVLINSFYDDQNDCELQNLLNYLENYLLHAPDVRVINEQIFNFAKLIDQYNAPCSNNKIPNTNNANVSAETS